MRILRKLLPQVLPTARVPVQQMVHAWFLIALVVALVVGADAALPAFAVGTWELVNPDANSERVLKRSRTLD